MPDIVKTLPEDSWVRTFISCYPLAEPPRSYLVFSALAMLGAAIGRKVWFDLDVHTVYPLLNLLLIGPSGVGKSTALVDIAMDNLIRPLPDDMKPFIITGKSTKEALHDDLVMNPHSIIVASELSNFFSKEKYQEGMISYMTDLLDLRPTSVRTKSGGAARIIHRPSVAVCGGSTKEWLQEMMPSTSGEGGFLPRFLIVKEDHKYQRIADPKRYQTDAERNEIELARIHMFHQFRQLVQYPVGKIDFDDYEASDTYSLWYQSFTPETGTLSPFAARAGAHILRLALLLSISCGRPGIDAECVQCAIGLYNYTQGKLHEVIVPMSPQGRLLARILECVGTGELESTSIRRAMRNYCAAQEVDRLLDSLVMDGSLKREDGKYRRTSK